MFIGGDPGRIASLDQARLDCQIGQLIYDSRVAASLTQRQLANRVGTTQSVISRLEDADYNGHSLTMLARIARALGTRLKVEFV
jgi:transcriptional regulator with XRE-family HTH domain